MPLDYDEYTKHTNARKGKGKTQKFFEGAFLACFAIAISPLVAVFCLSNCLCGCPHIRLCGNDRRPTWATDRQWEKKRERLRKMAEEKAEEERKWFEEHQRRGANNKSEDVDSAIEM